MTAVAIADANARRDTSGILTLFEESGINEDRLVRTLSVSFAKIAAPYFAHGFTN